MRGLPGFDDLIHPRSRFDVGARQTVHAGELLVACDHPHIRREHAKTNRNALDRPLEKVCIIGVAQPCQGQEKSTGQEHDIAGPGIRADLQDHHRGNQQDNTTADFCRTIQ
ncbi:hypothetical protein [Bradyrhizobium campsiandrae]|uniref:hypothetical protein n=1 Tax=Bradyrhizobium campsiandrae TaxID=1729892 RepID=UPI001FCEB7CF|nr:hypothetical protein [Bradyrhizobium campsiandrae]